MDISILKDGVEVHPVAPVSVSIKLLDAPSTDEFDEANVVHFGDEAEVVESNIQREAVRFETDGFSVYVVTYTISTFYMDAAGNTFNIEVEYGTEAGIPEGAELAVAELEGDEAEAYTARAAEALNVNGSQVAYAKALDIAILVDGQPVQPTTPVSVSIKLLDAPEADDNTNIDVIHFGGEPKSVSCAFEGDAVTFQAEGFSVYVVTFTKDAANYSITVDTAISETTKLSDVLNELKIAVPDENDTSITVADIYSVLSADETMLAIQPDDKDWTITPTAAFDSVALTLTLMEGKGTVTINVSSRIKVTVTAENKTKTYGDADPELTATVTGLVGEETINYTLSRETGEDVGNYAITPAGEAVQGNYEVSFVPATLTVNRATVTVTADAKTKTYGDADPELTATVDGLKKGDAESVITYTLSRVEGEDVSEYAITATGDTEQGNYEVTFVPGTLSITRPTVTAVDSTYDGEAHELVASDNPAVLYFSLNGGEYKYGAVPTAKDAGDYTVSYKLDGEEEARSVISTIDPAPVTLTANSGYAQIEKDEAGEPVEKKVSGYTYSVEEDLTFEGVSASGSGMDVGMYPVEFTGVTVGQTRDTTENYVVTEAVPGMLIITEGEEAPIDKKMTGFSGDLAEYTIKVNPGGDKLNGSADLTLKDTFSDNQSIIYSSIKVEPEDAGIVYDYSGYTGTFTIHDETSVTITYTTRVSGEAGQTVKFTNTARLGKYDDSQNFIGCASTTNEAKLITPAGTDISGHGGVYRINVFAYADGHMEQGLTGATFRLLDSNQRPIQVGGSDVTFTTGADGYVVVTLTGEQAIRKNTAYYLEMTTAPYTVTKDDDDEDVYTYYQKDNTLYSFLITDDPNYSYGGVYSYFNDDVLKVRCYPESAGVNVTKRFSGNYSLTDAQKANIEFALQKEDIESSTEKWDDVERHPYSDFSWGSLNFETGSEGKHGLEPSSHYRVQEEKAGSADIGLPQEIEHSVSYTITYQEKGVPAEYEGNDFTVYQDDLSHNYSVVVNNSYVDHRLTIVVLNEETGDKLPGATFTVYEASDEAQPVATYITGENGALDIRRGDAGANYASNTLYYAVQTGEPEHYLLPDNPEKIWFCFPEGEYKAPAEATDLTASYKMVTVSNHADTVRVPVTVAWGLEDSATWPDEVVRVVLGLYQSVNGGDWTPVQKDGVNWTISLDKEQFFDNSTFVNLPAVNSDGEINYTFKENGVYGGEGGAQDITSSYAASCEISGTGWYVVKHQPAVTVVVEKKWFGLDVVTQITDASALALKPEVTFDLYRMTAQADSTSPDRDALERFLADAEPVSTGLALNNDNAWTQTLPSLEAAYMTDDGAKPYYYYALELEESMPENHRDTYEIAAATEDTPRTLTINNIETPITITVSAENLSKVYGQKDPAFDFDVTVKGAIKLGEVSGPDVEANYTFTATNMETGEVKTIAFKCTRDPGEDATSEGYVITPEGNEEQGGYRVVFKKARLTIDQKPITVKADKSKVYGDDDPAVLVSFYHTEQTAEGGTELVPYGDELENHDDTTVIEYQAERDPGQDATVYTVTVTGRANQGNYYVTFEREGTFTIIPAEVTVTPEVAEKVYGDDDPDELTAKVTGLKYGDAPDVIEYQLTREAGEDIGSYDITVTVEQETQDNYTVKEGDGTDKFTIVPAIVIARVEDADKVYGAEDPEWTVTFEGLQDGDTIDYEVTRDEGQDAGSYTVTPVPKGEPKTDAAGETYYPQGNYYVYVETGTLIIDRAELTVRAGDVKKIKGTDDPALTIVRPEFVARDEELVASEPVYDSETQKYVVTFSREGAAEPELRFTLARDEGEAPDVYPITVGGSEEQKNYFVEFEEGAFTILDIYDITVTQETVDPMEVSANPGYSYAWSATLGEVGYSKTGAFDMGGENSDEHTLQIPQGAVLTVDQQANAEYDSVYKTTLAVDGGPYPSDPEHPNQIEKVVDTIYTLTFTHARDCLPVYAKAQTQPNREEDAQVVVGSRGFAALQGDQTVETFEATYKDNYTLPEDRYYEFEHASLYNGNGAPIEGLSNITGIKYDPESKTWLYSQDTDEEKIYTEEMPADAQLVLFYTPKFTCKIGEEKFYTLKQAMDYVAEQESHAQIIEMLIPNYAMRESDKVSIPADEGYEITLKTAGTDYEGEAGTSATITRVYAFKTGDMFECYGKLTLENITIDGGGVSSANVMVSVKQQSKATETPSFTLAENAKLTNAVGGNGAAIYINAGTTTLYGKATGNTAANGAAIYIEGSTQATVTVAESAELSGNSASQNGGAMLINNAHASVTIDSANVTGNSAAANGGAAHITAGALYVNGSVYGNATTGDGGAVYMAGGTVTVGENGKIGDSEAEDGANQAVNGGGVYLNAGTLNVNGSVQGNEAAVNGGGIYRAGGTLNMNGGVTGNAANNGGGIYNASAQSLTIPGNVTGNTAANNGGGIYMTSYTLTTTGNVTGNTATNGNGGGIYMASGALKLSGGSVSDNTATNGNGGAVCAMNVTTTVEDCEVSGNKAQNAQKGLGGAVYMEGGVLNVNTGSAFDQNRATSGGAVYATSGEINIHNGDLTGNTAANDGGAICVQSASVKVEGGNIGGAEEGKGNTSTGGSGGAIYAESGAVTITGGALTGNKAQASAKGLGGAVYAGTGNVTYSGGVIQQNKAVNGAAIYVGSGVATITANITDNTPSENGGAVGVGTASARLNFSGDANVYDNKVTVRIDNKDVQQQRNVCLNVDSEAVVNAKGSISGNIGIYVPGEYTSDLVVKRGDLGGYFGAYTNSTSLSKFKNDRYSELEVGYANNRLFWKKQIPYYFVYKSTFEADEPPKAGAKYSDTSGSGYLKIVSLRQHNATTIENKIYDLVTAMDLYNNHKGDFETRIGKAKAAAAVYAYTYTDNKGNDGTFDAGLGFDDFVTEVNWDRVNRKWVYKKQNGKDAGTVGQLVILYSDPTFLTIVNNTEPAMTLTITELKVLGRDAADGGSYGYVTARNGATVQTLEPITGPLVLAPGESRKILFPGAAGATYTLKGTFSGEGVSESTTIEYTINGVAQTSIEGTEVDLSTDRLVYNDIREIVFGDALNICKVGNEPFTRLKAAMSYIEGLEATNPTENKQYTIEMLVDYLVPKGDVLEIPAGYDITFTTAATTGTDLPYTGQGTTIKTTDEDGQTGSEHKDWAIISRDVGNSGASVTADQAKLTVNNMVFDGLAVAGTGNGGAISTSESAVNIDHCVFKGYRSKRGGALFVNFGSLSISNSDFSNCKYQAEGDADKAGGGAIWATSKELTVDHCTFTDCACLTGRAQAGAIFHNIRNNNDIYSGVGNDSDIKVKKFPSGYPTGTKTKITNCKFYDCSAKGGSGGTVESDALDVTFEDCEFHGSFTDKDGGSGGAINTFITGDAADTKGDKSVLRIKGCLFDDCRTSVSNGYGGAVRCSAKKLVLQESKFVNCQSKFGGAVAMSNSTGTEMYVYGCTFDGCSATSNGGAIACANASSSGADTKTDVTIADTKDYTDDVKTKLDDGDTTYQIKNSYPGDTKDNDGHTHFIDCSANKGGGLCQGNTSSAKLSVKNAHFEDCDAKTSYGGGIYTVAVKLSITGESNTFKRCTANGSGGGVFHLEKDAENTKAVLVNVEFDGCKANNKGNGGGMYSKARTLTINYYYDADTDEIGEIAENASSAFKNCTAQSGGGGLFHDYASNYVKIANCDFEQCVAEGAQGGGLNTNTQTLTIKGSDSRFKACTAQTGGGGLYHNRNANGSSLEVEGYTFEDCVTNGNHGGAIYAPEKTVTVTNVTVKGCSAPANGGGICLNSPTTATITGCTFSGNTVSNNDSKGAGIYMGGGTVAYRDSTTYDCVANGNGGGLYQADGTLIIYGGVIHGSAANGGGIYQTKNTVNQYGGQVGGTATVNGGGVYKSNGTYNVGDSATVGEGDDAVTYSGGDIGKRISVEITDGETTAIKTFDSSAVNGGGVYNNNGTFNLKSGAAIGEKRTDEATGETTYTATASGNGGGVYVGEGTFNMTGDSDSAVATVCGHANGNGGGVWNGCTGNNAFNHTNGYIEGSAANGGGLYQNGKYTFTNGCITGTATANGGAVYAAASFTINNGCTVGKNGETSSSAVNGGGVYVVGGTTTLYKGGKITGATATDGGGAYVAGGVMNIGKSDNTVNTGGDVTGNTATGNGGGVYVDGGTLNLRQGAVTQNTAEQNGGGVYHGGGTFNMSGGAIGGSSDDDRNIAARGAALFVGEGMTAVLNGWISGGLSITHNHATDAGGGIAVGGPNVKLYFKNLVTVKGNTMGQDDTRCNVYLDRDRNTVIQTNGTDTDTSKNNYLDPDSFIGVYTSDDQDQAHGLSGTHFGAYVASGSNPKCFVNDRRPYLYGVLGTPDEDNPKPIDWASFKCKITDNAGKLLYTDESGTPAVYVKLENNGGSGTDNAFGTLYGGATLYERKVTKAADGTETVTYEEYSGSEYQIQMLAPRYELNQKITLISGMNVTLTTASTEEDECGFKYTGNAKEAEATIIRHANNFSMISTAGGNLTLTRITLDGGSEEGRSNNTAGGILYITGGSEVHINAKAKLCNSNSTGNGSGIRMQDGKTNQLELNGGAIENCYGCQYGGGISVKEGTLTMNSGSITGCSAQNGGAVRVDTTMVMKGGTVSGNTATVNGGGISLNGTTTRLFLSNDPVVRGNTLNGESCNVHLNDNKADIVKVINAQDLTGRADIGVYTTTGGTRNNYGSASKPFGTWTSDANLHCFVNDCNANLRGGKMTGNSIFWLDTPLIVVEKQVASDWSADKNVEFSFTVKLNNTTFASLHNVMGDMDFNRNGEATVKLKDDEINDIKTAVLPTDYLGKTFTVTENLTAAQQEDYTTTIEKDGGAYTPEAEAPYTVIGTLGENIDAQRTDSTSESRVVFTNTREVGSLTISNTVTSYDDQDLEKGFDFTLNLDPAAVAEDKPFDFVRTDAAGNRTTGQLYFAAGEYLFTLKHGESIVIVDLPTDLPYSVTESLTEQEALVYRTRVSVDGGVEAQRLIAEGTVGAKVTEQDDGTKSYSSAVTFRNSRIGIVCKITNGTTTSANYRELLYYMAGQERQPAIYDRLEDAFAQINTGGLKTENGGSYSGQYRIEMVVSEYKMEGPATLNSGRTVILSTAQTGDQKYPYNEGEDDGRGNVAVVTRGGFTDDSMIINNGTLTVEKITLDGGSALEEDPITANTDGGIIKTNGKLTIDAEATLRNSAVGSEQVDPDTGAVTTAPHNGGAIWQNNGVQLVMNGTIENCSATNGGGIYAAEGFRTINLAGSVTSCAASENGGAIWAGVSTASTGITLNQGATFTGNAASEDGGAIRSKANLKMNAGSIGGVEMTEGNTAGGSGGGIYMDTGATFNMSEGVFQNNQSTGGNGGALVVQSAATIKGGSFTGNVANGSSSTNGCGGAIYATGDAEVTLSGTATAITGNSARIGGAVCVARGSFTMKGGSITQNRSPEGAIATDENAMLTFSGNSVVTNNTAYDGQTAMNVYLGCDSNTIIQTTGLGSGASIGVYVADGVPEPQDGGADKPIYYGHGIAGRNFGTYTGSAPNSARLAKFTNDREDGLTGYLGAAISGSEKSYYVMWQGKSLLLKVYMMDDEGNVTETPVNGAKFTLTNIHDADAADDDVQVWSGTSNANGEVNIPWTAEERAGGQAASFIPGSSYVLEQTASAGEAVKPAGTWTLTIGKDNSLTSTMTKSGETEVNRILSIGEGQFYLGGEVDVYNDTRPTITFDANGDTENPAVLSDNSSMRTDPIEFKPIEEYHDYVINEKNPTRPGYVFQYWLKVGNESEDPSDGVGDDPIDLLDGNNVGNSCESTDLLDSNDGDDPVMLPGDGDDDASDGGQEDDSNIYVQGDNYRFRRESNADSNVTLKAQWSPVVCKITDTSDRLMYVNGNPAVYMTLEDGFKAFNEETFTLPNGSRATARKIKMLVQSYTLEESVELANRKTAVLTTAGKDSDGYPYTGQSGTYCTITRGFANDSMIVDNFNLTLTNITLDGGSKLADPLSPSVEGGIVRVGNAYAQLTVGAGATLQNSSVTGNGGAVYAIQNTIVTLSGGTITGNAASAADGDTNHGKGGGVYADGTLRLSGTKLTGNEAVSGGGIAVSSAGTLNATGGTVVSNQATENGGGIYAEGGVTMSGGNIGQSDQGNTAVNGAGIYLAGSGTFSGGTIIGNAAENGAGGGLSIAGNATLSGVAITGNTASSGAGVFVLDGATMNMTGGSVTGNTASDEYSGAIDVGGSGARLNFSGNPTVYNNPAQSGQQRNVALTVDSNQVINVTDELGSTAKIGVYAPKTGSSGEGTLYDGHGVPGMPFGHFANGTEDNLGVFINDWDALTYAVSAETGNNIEWATLIARVSNDNGRTWTYHDWLANDKTYTKNGQTIRRGAFDQAASLNGGVIVETLLQTHDRYTTTGEIVLGKNRTVTLRTTDDSTYNPRGFVSTIKRGEFANKAASMFRVNDGTFVITNMMLDGDKANRTDVSANGGLVYVANGGLTIGDGATLQNAVTTGNGGAVYAAAGASVTVTGGAITDNIAANGGGIYADGTAKTADTRNTINVTNGTISNNTATCNGGGLYVRDGRWAELLGVTMSQNKALATSADSLTNGEHNGCGGAIYVRPTAKVDVASSQAKDSTFTQNDALRAGGGIFVFDNGTLTVTNAILSQNVSACGGGIGGLLKVNITVTNTLLNGNRAIKGDTPIAGNKTIFHNGNGGGIGLQSASAASKLTVIGQKQVDDVSGTLVGNTATNNGGGIFINGNANGVLDGVTVTGNTAVSGGGMYSGSLTLKNGVKITGNATTATIGTDTGDIKAAGGVYLSNGGTLTLAGDSDQNNLTTIDGNYTTTENKSSNLRLPFNNATKDNEGTSVKLTAEFKGKIRVVNPGTIYSTFGSSDDLSYLFDSDNPTTWETVPNITSEDGSRLFGRIESVSGGVRLYWWQEPICKITDGSAVLYLDAECTKKAVYMSLYDSGSLITSAFGALNDTGVKFYKSKDTPYTGSSYFVEMLDDCEINEPVEVNKSGTNRKVITLKTAEKTVTDDLPFRGSGTIAELSPGPLYRKGTYNFLFTLNHDTDLTVKKITVDGGVDYELDGDGHIRFGDNDKPVYKTGSYISPKDGVLFQIGGTASLTLEAEATLQNAYTNHEYGGGAISFGNNSGSGNNRYLTMKAGSKIIRCCAETAKNGKGGVGGAIMAYSAASNHITIEGGTIEDCWAEKGGGAIYLTSANSELTVKGGTIQNCTAAQGGGLYLNDGARMKIGTDVAANGAVTGGQIAFKDNYGTDYASYNDKLNGKDHTGREYKYADGKVPQDIFVAKLTGNPASAITVTGRIQTYADGATDDQKKAAQGSIWVWAEPGQSTGHYKNAEQFAVFDSGLVKAENNKLVSTMPLTATETESCGGNVKKFADLKEEILKETLRAFRNALEDSTTKNDTGYYLTGTPWDKDKTSPATQIFWGPAIDGFDIVFRKIDGNGDPLPNATFTLYVANDAGTAISEPYQVSGEDVTAISGGDPDHDKLAGRDAEHTVAIKKNTGTATDPVEEDREVYDADLGLVVFEKIPPGVYFIKETLTDTDAGSVTIGTNTYKPVEEMYRLVVGNKGLYNIHVANRDADGKSVWTEKQADDTWPSDTKEAPMSGFVKGEDDKYTPPTDGKVKPTDTVIPIYTFLNESALSRRVMLQKVDNSTATEVKLLSGAHFRIFRADLTEVTEGQPKDATGKNKGYYESLDSGVYFSGKLPFGTYYLVETVAPTSPSGYSGNIGNVFKLTVKADTKNADGVVTASGTTVDSTPVTTLATAATATKESDIVDAFKRWMTTGSETAPTGGGEPPAGTGD
ncbi:MAG: hypothetical protein IJI71_02590 [Clostridia bacterium]|nr:hypothetical protein [Clostridia bacterium]